MNRLRSALLACVMAGCLAVPSLASASALRREARGTAAAKSAFLPRCYFTVQSPVFFNNAGQPAFQLVTTLDCGTTKLWHDVRVCPQQLVSGQWQFIPGGTCHGFPWAYSAAYVTLDEYSATPGVTYRNWAKVWLQYNGYTMSYVSTSP